MDRADGKTVGGLWFGITPSPGARTACLYDLHLHENHRCEQHAPATLHLLEARCRKLGAASIGLQCVGWGERFCEPQHCRRDLLGFA